MASGNKSSVDTGENIIIAGLVVQLLFFSLFVVTAGLFNLRMRRNPTREVLNKTNNPWQKHLLILYISSILIFIRSLFRLIEYLQGNAGFLVSHEIFLYVFDGCLMFGTMVVLAVVHPAEITAATGVPYVEHTGELAQFR